MDDRIVFDVCGQIYAVPTEFIENGPSSRLKKMCKAKSFGNIIINRPPEYFAAILAFYQTGELHLPMTSCPGAFMKELEFWEIPSHVITDCCHNRLKSFLDEQDTLRNFQESLNDEKISLTSYSYLKNVRARVWQTVDYKKHSLLGKIYFSTTVFMVLMAIFALAYSTDSSFQRTMTNCERLAYMASTDMEGYDIVKPLLEEHCSDESLPENSTDAIERGNSSETFALDDQSNDNKDSEFLSYMFHFVHRRVKKVNTTWDSEEPGIVERASDPGVAVEETGVTVQPGGELMKNRSYVEDLFWNEPFNQSISFNDTQYWNISMNESVVMSDFRPPDIHILELFLETKYVKVPNLKIKLFILIILEVLTTIYFTIDITLRLCSCPYVKYYFFSIINCADALSLLGSYLYFSLYYLYPHLRYGSWIDNLAYVQMLRSLRLFRIVSNVRAGKVLAYSTRKNVKDLLILVLFLIAGMCTFAGLLYVAEDKSTISSIPEAWYWAVITMTTVGYGDIQPKTGMGRGLACICAIVGVILLALTVPIFANHFLILYQHVESESVARKIQKHSPTELVEIKTKVAAEKDRKEIYQYVK